METPPSNQSQAVGTSASDTLPAGPMRAVFGEAIRYWELRRIVYNFALVAVAAAWLVFSWPHFRPALTLSSLGILSVLALLANLCYCAAYLVDIPLRASLGDTWKRWRWGLWLAGMLFAILFENYWIADEIYPYVR